MNTLNDNAFAAQIYDLLETLAFDELTTSERQIVLTHISRAEYDTRRQTLLDIRRLMAETDEAESPIPMPGRPSNLVRRPIRLRPYAAAAFLLLFAGAGLLFVRMQRLPVPAVVLLADTVHSETHDTVYHTHYQTIEVVRERIVSQTQNDEPTSEIPATDTALWPRTFVADCESELCPGELRRVGRLSSNGNLTGDSALSAFIVADN